jgi:hypothetical protein
MAEDMVYILPADPEFQAPKPPRADNLNGKLVRLVPGFADSDAQFDFFTQGTPAMIAREIISSAVMDTENPVESDARGELGQLFRELVPNALQEIGVSEEYSRNPEVILALGTIAYASSAAQV